MLRQRGAVARAIFRVGSTSLSNSSECGSIRERDRTALRRVTSAVRWNALRGRMPHGGATLGRRRHGGRVPPHRGAHLRRLSRRRAARRREGARRDRAHAHDHRGRGGNDLLVTLRRVTPPRAASVTPAAWCRPGATSTCPSMRRARSRWRATARARRIRGPSSRHGRRCSNARQPACSSSQAPWPERWGLGVNGQGGLDRGRENQRRPHRQLCGELRRDDPWATLREQ